MMSRLLTTLTALLQLYSVLAEDIPSFIEEPKSAVVPHHASVSLQCEVSPSSASVRWIRNDDFIDVDKSAEHVLNGSNLIITKFRTKHHANDGTYQCVASTPVGSIISKRAVLSKPVLHKFVNSEDMVISVLEGSTATIPCQYPESKPEPVLTFELNSVAVDISQDNYMLLKSGNLLIKNTKFTDHGNYRCIATNPVSGKTRTTNSVITLVVKPTSTAERVESLIVDSESTASKLVEGRKGQDLLIECGAVGIPTPHISWEKYGGSLPEGQHKMQQGNLLLMNLQKEYQGTYLCKADNGIGKPKIKAVVVEVQEPANVMISTPEYLVNVGESVELECEASGLPVTYIFWYHNAQIISTSDRIQGSGVSSHRITKVKPHHSGMYTCIAETNSGSNSGFIRLEVKDDPATSDPNTHGALDVNTNFTTIENGKKDKPNRRKGKKKNKGRKGRRKNKNERRKKKRKNKKQKKKPGMGSDVVLVPPSKPDIEKLSDSSVKLNWTVPSNEGLSITFFRVQYKVVPKGDWVTEEYEIGGHIRMTEVSHLKPGNTYKFRMAAVYSNNDNKVGPTSERFHLESEPADQPMKPQARPKIVQVLPLSNEGIQGLAVKWQYQPVKNAPIAGFLLYHKPYNSKGKYKKVALFESGLRNHILQNLLPGTQYSIQMQSFNSAGESILSSPVVEKTNGEPPVTAQLPRKTVTTTTQPVREKTDTQSSSELLYIVLGIVLGVMLLMLFVLMFMCWWKQREQRRMTAMGDLARKFQDPAQYIHSDSMRKKYMNGGFLINGMNGSVANGHVPNRMNINVNPLSDVNGYNNRTDPDIPKNYQSPMNGGISTFSRDSGHPTSDNNCNSITRQRPYPSHTSSSSRDNLEDNNLSCNSSRTEPVDNRQPLLYRTVSETQNSPTSDSCFVPCDVSASQSCEDCRSHGGYCDNSFQNYSHNGRQRRKKRRHHSRELNTKDQATNTDLSSNEGTLEYTSFHRSPPDSNSQLQTFSNNSLTYSSPPLTTDVH